MAENRYCADIEAIFSHRCDNGADYWATTDGKLLKGSPFTTLESAVMLTELGVEPSNEVLTETAKLIFAAWREDGRFKLSPEGAIYPCHTIGAVRALCHLGYADDIRLQKTFTHLLSTQHVDGGWKCQKFSFGRGPETKFSNPGPTLTALDAFRFTEYLNRSPTLDRAVEFLLGHWTTKRPLGPCHYGIGSRFMQVAYPFSTYNLFFYIYVLSFYESARRDARFLAAFHALKGRMKDGMIVVERPNPKLKAFECCKQGQSSELATARYREILRNLGGEA